MRKLLPLIEAGDKSGLALAYPAIESLEASAPDSNRRYGLLNALQTRLDGVETADGSASREFVFLIDDLVKQRLRFAGEGA